MPFEGTCNLQSAEGALIRIDFTATYLGATPGSSYWEMVASNFRCRVEMPTPSPGSWQPNSIHWYVTDTIIDMVMGQTPLGSNVYSQPLPFNTQIVIRSGNGSVPRVDDYRQYHRFLRNSSSPLYDPMNGTDRFQTNMFFATPFAAMAQGNWPIG